MVLSLGLDDLGHDRADHPARPAPQAPRLANKEVAKADAEKKPLPKAEKKDNQPAPEAKAKEAVKNAPAQAKPPAPDAPAGAVIEAPKVALASARADLTLGSVDKTSGYRPKVALTQRGAAVEPVSSAVYDADRNHDAPNPKVRQMVRPLELIQPDLDGVLVLRSSISLSRPRAARFLPRPLRKTTMTRRPRTSAAGVVAAGQPPLGSGQG